MNKAHSEHSAIKLFPLLEGEEFAALCEDIRKHGLQEPVGLLDDQVIDGRNRLRACQKLGIEPEFREFDGDPYDIVMSLNYHRRHLKPHQKGEALRQYLAAKGGAIAKHKRGRPRKNGHNGHLSVAQVAKNLGVPRKTAERQIKAAETYAALPKSIQEKVDSGECPIELAPKVSEAVDRKILKVSAKTKQEIQRIEDETAKLQKRINGAINWLQSVETGCRFHGDFILSRQWTKAEKQIVDRACDAMSTFIGKWRKIR